jgi:hypothetical protein
MTTMNDKNKTSGQIVRCSPPSHPTTLGDVWVGTTRPSASALVELLTMNEIASEQAGTQPRREPHSEDQT